MISEYIDAFSAGLSALVLIGVTLLMLTVIILFIVDISQIRYAMRRNYPVIGRFRSLFEHPGAFFRQYFFCHG